jgi:cell division protein FtsI/penicillin-binding protein 2
MRQTLADLMIHGTAKESPGKRYPLAGKTGTAWSDDYPKENGETKVGTFAGFGPVEDPRVVVYVGIQDPTRRPMTGSLVAPVFREIAEEVLQHEKVPPSRE